MLHLLSTLDSRWKWTSWITAIMISMFAFFMAPAILRGQNPGLFYQITFAPAVSLACGLGFRNFDETTLTPVHEFLQTKSERFDCDILRKNPPPERELTLFQSAHRYLLYVTGITWSWTGVSWAGLWPVYSAFAGFTAFAAFYLFRLGMSSTWALLATLALLHTSSFSSHLPHLRDYSKAPFLLMALGLALRMNFLNKSRAQTYLLPIAAGLVTGVGLGFRTDLLVIVPLYLMLLGASLWPKSRGEWKDLFICSAGFLIAFLATAAPVLRAYHGANNTVHVVLLGLTDEYTQFLGLISNRYNLFQSYDDHLIAEAVNGFGQRIQGLSDFIDIGTPGYNPLCKAYFSAIVHLFPADLYARFLASIHGTLTSSWFGSRGAWLSLLALLGVHFFHHRLGWILAILLIYLLGYPFLQFHPRHYFFLEIVPYFAAFFLMSSALRILIAHPRPKEWWTRIRASGVFTFMPTLKFSSILILGLLLPLLGLRIYQQHSLRAYLQEINHAPRQPLESSFTPDHETGLLEFPSFHFPRFPHPGESYPVYLVVEITPDCPSPEFEVTFRYSRPGWTFKQLASNSARLYFPVHQGQFYNFIGVEVPLQFRSCIHSTSIVKPTDRFPVLPIFASPGDNQQRWLFQKFPVEASIIQQLEATK